MAEDDKAHVADCQKKAAEIGFDLTKQFLTLSLAGIAYIVGLNTTGAVSTVTLWATILLFGVSTLVGLLFLMRGVGQISVENSYDIYNGVLRWLSGIQILLVIAGVAFLIPTISKRAPTGRQSTAGNLEVKLDSQQSILYNADPAKNVTIEVSEGKAKVTVTPKAP